VNPHRSVEEEILDRFDSLLRHAADTHAPEFLGADVTMPQAKVLYLVSLRPGISMSTLATELQVGPPAVSGLVDRLVAGGYLQRREDPGDRRQQLVTATPAGIAALDRLRELNSEALRRLITGLDARELEALLISVTALDREIQRLDELSPSRSAQPERTSA
jgi:DNA-binding MarR family transcriptional regulator